MGIRRQAGKTKGLIAGLVCILISGAVFNFWYFQPKLKAMAEIENTIDWAKEELKEQRMLYSLFPQVNEMHDEIDHQCEAIGVRCEADLPPAGADRGKQTIEEILTGIRFHAKGSGFFVKRAIPVAETVSPESPYFKVKIDLTGKYSQIKAMLTEIPHVDHIETLEAQSNLDAMDVSLLVWIGNDLLY